MIRRSSLISSQTKVDQKLMAHELVLEPRFLLLLYSPISLGYVDRMFVDSRLFFRHSHVREGNVVCARQKGSWRSWLRKHICRPAVPYQSFSMYRGSNSYFDCTIGQRKRSCSNMSVVELSVDVAYHLRLGLSSGKHRNRDNRYFTFAARTHHTGLCT
jgi:hypothetical protein